MGEPGAAGLRTLEAYRLEIHSRLDAVRERADELLAASFISNAPQSLAKAIRSVVGVLGAFVDQVVAETSAGDDPKTLDRSSHLLRSADERLRRLAPHLRYIATARPENLPWRFLRPVEQLAEELLGGGTSSPKVLLRPQWHYNYSCRLQDHRKLYFSLLDPLTLQLKDTSKLEALKEAMPDPLYVISFPDVERKASLLHALLGHEIGHLVADTFLTRAREGSYLEAVWDELGKLTEKRQRGKSGRNFLFFDKLVKDTWERAKLIWRRALEELLSDLVGAHLFGPAALFASYELSWQQPLDISPSEPLFYPSWRRRIRELVRFLDGDGEGGRSSALSTVAEVFTQGDDVRRRATQDRIEELRRISAQPVPAGSDELVELVYAGLPRWIEEGKKFLETSLGVRTSRGVDAGPQLRSLIERLDRGVPPDESDNGATTGPASPGQVLTAGWLHKIGDEGKHGSRSLEERERDRARRNELVAAAIQFSYLTSRAGSNRGPRVAASGQPEGHPIGVLGRKEIADRMGGAVGGDRLVITPILDPAETYGDASIDLRLGNEFLVFTREAVSTLDPLQSGFPAEWEHRLHRRIVRAFGERFVIHPGQMVIGSTLEYMALPRDVMAYVIGKSTWGRMGLVIATATKVDPGFRGCITLEIANLGGMPLTLVPGAPIAQIVLHATSPAGGYSGSYDCASGPRLPDLRKLHASLIRLAAFR